MKIEGFTPVTETESSNSNSDESLTSKWGNGINSNNN